MTNPLRVTVHFVNKSELEIHGVSTEIYDDLEEAMMAGDDDSVVSFAVHGRSYVLYTKFITHVVAF